MQLHDDTTLNFSAVHRMTIRNQSATIRKQLAYESARIALDCGDGNFERARRKAAARAGADCRDWPSLEEVRDAALAERRLLSNASHDETTARLRRQALQAMHRFADFSPRLVGALQIGLGDENSTIELCLFADTPEEVLLTLLEQRIQYRENTRSLRCPRGKMTRYPVFAFIAGNIAFELIVLPHSARRNPPLDPITERPQRGSSIKQIAHLLEEADDSDRA